MIVFGVVLFIVGCVIRHLGKTDVDRAHWKAESASLLAVAVLWIARETAKAESMRLSAELREIKKALNMPEAPAETEGAR